MSDRYLILHPSDPYTKLDDVSSLMTVLVDVGLIRRDTYTGFEHIRYLPGKQFYQLFDDKEATVQPEYRTLAVQYTTRIELFDDTRVITGMAYTEHPVCPNCGYKEPTLDVITDWYDSENRPDFRWRCPQCAAMYAIEQLDWQHSLGFACYSLEIYGIGWHQVVPSDRLLTALCDFAGCDFSWIYRRI